MEAVPVKIVPRDFGETRRRDWWWVEPMIVFAVFGSFVVYATWAAFQNAHYTFGPYLSPFYAPVLWASPGDTVGLEHAWFGVKPAWFPGFLPFSPALKQVSPRWKTPVAAIWATAALAVASTLYAPAYSTLTTVWVPPRTLKSPSIVILRGRVAATRSSRMRFVTASWKCPSSRKDQR